MDPGTRACLAYVVGSAIAGTDSHHIYDTSRDRHIELKGSIQGTVIAVMDCDRDCKFMGTLPSLFDFGTHTPVTLEIEGNSFSGMDKSAQLYFRGMVSGSHIQLYDYADACDYHYELRNDQ